MSKLRVWWIPQVGMEKSFYVSVKSVEEGKRVLDIGSFFIAKTEQ